MKAGALLLSALTVLGCRTALVTDGPPNREAGQIGAEAAAGLPRQEQVRLTARNEALVEWQISRLAAACNAVAGADVPAGVRREALRLKAAQATSSYSVLTEPNALVQVLDLLAMANLGRNVWVEGGRAAQVFGDHRNGIEAAFQDIHDRVRDYAGRQLSQVEIGAVEQVVRRWIDEHPKATVLEFIRFDAFADALAAALTRSSAGGGLFARIHATALDAELLGERAIHLASRMPRLTEWHAEAAVANLLAEAELQTALAALRGLGEAGRELPARLGALEVSLSALPDELSQAIAGRPELVQVVHMAGGAVDRMKALDSSVQVLERQVQALANEIQSLGGSLQPQSVDRMIDRAGETAFSQARALVWLSTGCMAGLIVLHALLRRWGREKPLQ